MFLLNVFPRKKSFSQTWKKMKYNHLLQQRQKRVFFRKKLISKKPIFIVRKEERINGFLATRTKKSIAESNPPSPASDPR